MIRLYAWSTPNGFKPLILLEETGLPFELKPVDLRAGRQSEPAYLAVNPNGKIPALTDDDCDGEPLTLFESGAILLYLSEKTGQFLPSGSAQRFRVTQWLMFQMAAIGPTLGQLGFFARSEPRTPVAIERYRHESERLIGVLEAHLAQHDWLVDRYSVADMAMFPWIRACDALGLDLSSAPHLVRWRDTIASRPAVQRALATFETSKVLS